MEVSLSGSAANVRLMDSSSFSSYRAGRQHRYFGGLAKQSPVRLAIPQSGHWHVTVDMAGLKGTVGSSARILNGPLPALREVPLSSVPSLVRGPGDFAGADRRDDATYDVFISHASEDKTALVQAIGTRVTGGRSRRLVRRV